MAEAQLAAGTTVGFELDPSGSPDTFTIIDGFTSLGAIGETGEAKDQTTLSDTTKRYGKGIKDTPEQSLKHYYYPDDADQLALIQKAVAQEPIKMQVTWPSGIVAVVTIQLLGWQKDDNSAEDWEMGTISGRQSGAVDWTYPTP